MTTTTVRPELQPCSHAVDAYGRRFDRNRKSADEREAVDSCVVAIDAACELTEGRVALIVVVSLTLVGPARLLRLSKELLT